LRRLVHRRLDCRKPLVDLTAHFRVREHVEFVVPDGGEDARGDRSRVESGFSRSGSGLV
jgi:hypothetical protein